MRFNGSGNDALYLLPKVVPLGRFRLALTVDGIDFPVDAPDDTIQVVPRTVRPHDSHVISVNTTASLFAALNTTRNLGGGIILVQRGAYKFTTESIDLPPYVTLRGVSREHVHFVWSTEGVNLSNVPRYFIGGNSTFAIEDISVSCTRFYNSIIMDGSHQVSDPSRTQPARPTDPWVPCTSEDVPDCAAAGPIWIHSQDVVVRRVRIRADCYFRLTERGASPRRGLSANFTYEQLNAAIELHGQNYIVEDNDIYAAGHGIYLGHGGSSLWNSASNGIVRRNTINFGEDCYQIDSSSRIIFEHNACVGINLFSRGSAAGATYGGPASSFIWFASNSIRFVFGGDQEEMTLDGGYCPNSGSVTFSGENNLTVSFQQKSVYPQYCSPPGNCRSVDTNWTGAAMYVLGGQGQGQLRVFAQGGLLPGSNTSKWVLEKPFGGVGGGVPLDATSWVSVFEHREKSIYRDNLFTDGGPMQLYGGAFHMIVANNTFERTTGAIVEGLNHHGGGTPMLIPSYFIETFDNHIVEGMSYDGSVSGFRTSGYYNRSVGFDGASVAAVVYRNNTVDNGVWVIQGAVTDVIVEGNTMVNSQQCDTSTNTCAPAGLQVTNGQQPNGSTAVNTTFRIFRRNNVGL